MGSPLLTLFVSNPPPIVCVCIDCCLGVVAAGFLFLPAVLLCINGVYCCVCACLCTRWVCVYKRVVCVFWTSWVCMAAGLSVCLAITVRVWDIVVLMLGLVGVVTASSCVQILGFWAVVNKGEQRKKVEEAVHV